MFIIIKKKVLIICALVLAGIILITGVCFAVSAVVSANIAPRLGITVVIDAGHGGIDGGVVGVSGKIESELNLQVSKKLQEEFENRGIDVVMTRSSNNGLYGLATKNRKQKDMQARSKIINNAQPALVISIHMNSYPSSSESGAQVFYKKGSESGKAFAGFLQASFKTALNTKREAATGDYYVLNCSEYPSVIVECGFLSNPEEEKLLATAEYREKLAYNIFIGAMQYLNVEPYSDTSPSK